MKKWTGLLLGFVLLGSSCLSLLISLGTYVGEIKVVNDTFKNVRTVSVEEALLSDERIEAFKNGFPQFSATIRTVKEQSPDAPAQVQMFFRIRAPETASKIEPEAFVQIDGENVKTSALDSDLETKSNTTVTRIPRQRTHVDPFGNTVVVTYEDTVTNTTHWNELSCRVALDSDSISKVKKAASLKVRFYSGPSPITFTFEKKFLDAIVAVLTK